jgi:signal transduction histidine kinase
MQQAIYNLVDNAIKFNRNEGIVSVSVQTRTDRVVFEIKDSGIGISPMDQARLFDKYYNSPQPGSRESRSTGLGLAIVKSIAERHSGQVWVESQLGKGSTFFLSIPIQGLKPEPKKK